MSTPLYCPRCGADNEEKATYCTKCSFPLKRLADKIFKVPCPECGFEIQYRFDERRLVGVPKRDLCPECGHEFEIPDPKEVKRYRLIRNIGLYGILFFILLPFANIAYGAINHYYPMHPIIGIPIGAVIVIVAFYVLAALGNIRA